MLTLTVMLALIAEVKLGKFWKK